MKGKYSFRAHNLLLMALVIALNFIGILILRSASYNDAGVVSRQIIGSIAGVAICLIVSFIDYNRILKYARPLYLGTIIMLLLVLLIGAVRGGAGRWLVLPILGQVQPAEFAKVTLILFFAAFFEKNRYNINEPGTLLMMAVLIGIPVLLIVAEPNLSTGIIVSVIFIIMLFSCGLAVKLIALFTAAAGGFLWLIIFLFRTGRDDMIPFLQYYQKTRILGLLFPEEYSDTFYQQSGSITAIGSGGFFGKGLNNTDINSVKAGNFLIEEDTDFIFAIIGEELGFRGCFIILFIYLIMLLVILWIGARAKNVQGAGLCIGVAAWIGFQTFTNVAVATAIFPNTGVTLPFISRGVSSLLSLYVAIGLVMNVGYQSRE